MTDYTIHTTDTTICVEADRFRRDPDGDLYLYVDDNGDDPVGHVEAAAFVGIFETERADFISNDP